MQNFTEAEAALQKSLAYAQSANYVRGLSAVNVYLADCAVSMGDYERASRLLAEGLAGFKSLNLNEALNYEIAGRLSRLRGEYDQAESLLNQGLVYAQGFPHEIASLEMECSRLWKARGDSKRAEKCEDRAHVIWKKSGAVARLNYEIKKRG